MTVKCSNILKYLTIMYSKSLKHISNCDFLVISGDFRLVS